MLKAKEIEALVEQILPPTLTHSLTLHHNSALLLAEAIEHNKPAELIVRCRTNLETARQAVNTAVGVALAEERLRALRCAQAVSDAPEVSRDAFHASKTIAAAIMRTETD